MSALTKAFLSCSKKYQVNNSNYNFLFVFDFKNQLNLENIKADS